MIETNESVEFDKLAKDLRGQAETLTRGAVLGSDHSSHVPLEIPLMVIKNWAQRPRFYFYEPYYKDPARLIISRREAWSKTVQKTTGFWLWKKDVAETKTYPEFTTLQIHLGVNFPVLQDSGATAIHVLSLDNSPSVYSYLNYFMGDHSESEDETQRPATIADLQAFQLFLFLAQPL